MVDRLGMPTFQSVITPLCAPRIFHSSFWLAWRIKVARLRVENGPSYIGKSEWRIPFSLPVQIIQPHSPSDGF